MDDIDCQEIYKSKEKSKNVGIGNIHFQENVEVKIINFLLQIFKERNHFF